jgi:tRNA A-37 threonylcarbamoyl transferase component Bud32
MSDVPGRFIAAGRAADVYDLGDGTVLRRYRTDRDCSLEGRIMSWLAEQGAPVPVVHRAEGRDLVMDLVAGPTMLDDLGDRPWRAIAHARLLAALQRSINELRAPDWFPVAPGGSDVGDVVHLDLHPMNVILSPLGPVVIDWSNAARGDGSFDAAMTDVLMTSVELASVRERVGRRVVVEAFRSARGRSVVRRSLRDAATFRLTDPNTTAGERSRLHRLLDRSG